MKNSDWLQPWGKEILLELSSKLGGKLGKVMPLWTNCELVNRYNLDFQENEVRQGLIVGKVEGPC